MLTIETVPAFASHLNQAILEALARRVLLAEGANPAAEVNLVITDDEGMRAINRQFRGLDAATDVLSFSLRPVAGDTFVTPPDETEQLGDIIISYEKCLVQAKEYGHAPDRELAELFLHGLLHILGYDHEQEGDAAVMATKADAYLRGREEDA
jgi:probable rRNA maturation factor